MDGTRDTKYYWVKHRLLPHLPAVISPRLCYSYITHVRRRRTYLIYYVPAFSFEMLTLKKRVFTDHTKSSRGVRSRITIIIIIIIMCNDGRSRGLDSDDHQVYYIQGEAIHQERSPPFFSLL